MSGYVYFICKYVYYGDSSCRCAAVDVVAEFHIEPYDLILTIVLWSTTF